MPRQSWRKLYGAREWQAARSAALERANYKCKLHDDRGETALATVVDHIRPHKGNWALFINPDNLQALCKPCHDRHKQRQERRGYVGGCDVDGNPIDPM